MITQDLCEVCAVSSADLASARPLGCEVYSMNPRSWETSSRASSRWPTGSASASAASGSQTGCARRSRRCGSPSRASASRVFVAEWTDPPYGSGHWLPEMVEAAGGANLLSASGEYSYATTWPRVLAEEPELIVLAACGLPLEAALARSDGLRLPVRTVVVDGDAYFSRPAPRLADGVRQLAHLIHPEAVADPGLPAAELPARRRSARLSAARGRAV